MIWMALGVMAMAGIGLFAISLLPGEEEDNNEL